MRSESKLKLAQFRSLSEVKTIYAVVARVVQQCLNGYHYYYNEAKPVTVQYDMRIVNPISSSDLIV